MPKRYNSVLEKYDYYRHSKSEYVKNVFSSPTFSYENWKERNSHLQKVLAKFFNKPENNVEND